jgi:MFS family permease
LQCDQDGFWLHLCRKCGAFAATIWGDVFFKLPGLAAVAAAISVYGLGILIRPVGAFTFGHLANRNGRKDALVYALILMGASTLVIGLTPHRRRGAGAADFLSAVAGHQLRRGVRHRRHLGDRAGRAFKVPRSNLEC